MSEPLLARPMGVREVATITASGIVVPLNRLAIEQIGLLLRLDVTTTTHDIGTGI